MFAGDISKSLTGFDAFFQFKAGFFSIHKNVSCTCSLHFVLLGLVVTSDIMPFATTDGTMQHDSPCVAPSCGVYPESAAGWRVFF
jgi:hypothetical protein